MASKDFFAKPKLKAQSSRNPFDVSYKTVFSAPFGAILPCGIWRVAPDDYLEIQNENQNVSPALKRPTFMRLKEHIDYFFVPYSQLWTPSDNFFTGQDYYFSTAIQKIVSNNDYISKVPNTTPMFDGLALYEILKYQYGSMDMWTVNEFWNTTRLLDLLNYGNYRDFDGIGDDYTPQEMGFDRLPNMNFFALTAYQKVYYDHFRNTMFEKNKVHAYNLDDITTDIGTVTDQDVTTNYDRYADVFQMHYRWLKKDYFTSVQTNSLANPNMLGFDDLLVNQTFTSASNTNFGIPGINPNVIVGNNAANVDITGASTNVNQGNSIYTQGGLLSVASIRFAFAYDKLLRRMREGGQDFDKQMLAQFGITPVDQRHGKCFRIGGFVNRINPQSVIDTSSQNLGNIGGKLDTYSQNSDPLKFHVKEHGIVIAVYSTSVDNDYSGQRISRDNTAFSRFDYFHPVFQNQGLQPIFKFEYDAGSNNVIGQGARRVIGLNRRYSEYKTHIDEVHSMFNAMMDDAVDFMPWTSQIVSHLQPSASGSTDPLTMYNLVYNPRMLDEVFAASRYNGDWTNDPFTINMYHRVKKISNMSVDGEDF